MKNPAMVLPDAMKGIGHLVKAMSQGGVSEQVLQLVSLRASQINGCSVCVHSHAQSAKKEGATDERVAAVAAWREAPCFSDAERAALALAEAMTRLADRSGDAVSEQVWDEVADQYDEQQRAALILTVATTNLFNRLNATIKEPAGQTWG